MARQPTKGFGRLVSDAWGDPERVADVGINETFRHPDFSDFDRDDQVRDAMRIGVLAGTTASAGPKAFIARFTALLNED